MKQTRPSSQRPAPGASAPSVIGRLSAPTTLTYELGGIAYTTGVALLIMKAVALIGGR